jgi:glycerophosphoryl diester phosphodiesterase
MKKIIHIALLVASITGCTAQKMKITNAAFPAFDTEAHRGGRGLRPENTILAMYNAIDIGVTTLEMDTHITADGKVVVAHDDTFNPLFALTPDGKDIPKADATRYALYKMTYAEIARFDVGSKPYSKFPQQKRMKASVPLLADLIDSAQAYMKAKGKPQMFYNIETKCSAKDDGVYNPDPETFVKLLMDVIQKKGILPYVVIQSFDKRTIQVIHKEYPKVRTSYLVDNKQTFAANLADLGYTPFVYSPAYKLVTAEMVRQCHEKGIKIVPWTVNTKEEIDALKALSVDGIISDYPNLLMP